MSDTWFFSDAHFFHTILVRGTSKWEEKTGCRPFNTVDEMNETIIENINKLVKKGDQLWHLGDWSFGGKENIKIARDKINCANIHHISGNHDLHFKEPLIKSLFTCVYGDVHHCHVVQKKINGQMLVMSHYAMLGWPYHGHGSWLLFGHAHTSLNSWLAVHLPNAKMLDVGLEGHDFKPWHFDEIKVYMDGKSGQKIDHHG